MTLVKKREKKYLTRIFIAIKVTEFGSPLKNNFLDLNNPKQPKQLTCKLYSAGRLQGPPLTQSAQKVWF